MNCLDCNNLSMNVPAIAVCHDCGAGICTDHAVIESKHLTRMAGLGMPVPVEPPGRIIRCSICAHATSAVRNPLSHRRPKSHSGSHRTSSHSGPTRP
jgi:hypothetical protein